MPTLTVGVAAATGTLHSPEHGWAGEVLICLVLFALIALTASLWEETRWSGFVQLRLMARHGLLAGSMLTAIPFGLIHVPLAFEADGWTGTTCLRPLPVVPDGWQYVPALMVLTVLVTVHRRLSGRSLVGAHIDAGPGPHSATELRPERYVLIRDDHTP